MATPASAFRVLAPRQCPLRRGLARCIGAGGRPCPGHREAAQSCSNAALFTGRSTVPEKRSAASMRSACPQMPSCSAGSLICGLGLPNVWNIEPSPTAIEAIAIFEFQDDAYGPILTAVEETYDGAGRAAAHLPSANGHRLEGGSSSPPETGCYSTDENSPWGLSFAFSRSAANRSSAHKRRRCFGGDHTMSAFLASDLEGRSLEEWDRVDAHRWSSYYLLFRLDPERDRPLALHWLLFNKLASELREDGHPVEMPPFPPLPYPRRMWAGGEIAWSRPLAPRLDLRRTTVVSRAEAKTGETGSVLLTSLSRTIQKQVRAEDPDEGG